MVVTAQRAFNSEPSAVQFDPLSSRSRAFCPEVATGPDGHNGLGAQAAPCQELRTVSPARVGAGQGYVRLATTPPARHTTACMVGP